MTDRKYMSSLDNYEIIPAVVSNIRHRNECIPYYGAFYSTDFDNYSLAGAYLPIIAAPMASVINENNYMDFDANGIMTVIPRTIPLSTRLEIMKKSVFVAVGLDEFKMIINDYTSLPEDTMICLDVANGHMKEVLDLSREAKTKFGDNLVLMTGNIANPDTYIWYANAGIDFVRCSIGSGNACFVNGTKIALKEGVKNIEDIRVGEIVKTKDEDGIVTNTTNYIYSGELQTIILENDDSLTCTPDHKILVVNIEDSEKITEDNLEEYSYWVSAKDITENQCLIKKL